MAFGDRVLRYKVKLDSWHQTDVETIFYQKLGTADFRFIVPAQVDDSDFADFVNPDGYLDIEKLQSDPEILRRFLKIGGLVEYYSFGVFDIPTRYEVADQLAKNIYKEYKEDDFLALALDIISVISLADEQPIVNTMIKYNYLTEFDFKKASIEGYPRAVRFVVQTGSEAIETYKLPEGGYGVETSEFRSSALSFEAPTKSFDLEPAAVVLVDKYGNRFGSLSSTLIIPR